MENTKSTLPVALFIRVVILLVGYRLSMSPPPTNILMHFSNYKYKLFIFPELFAVN